MLEIGYNPRFIVRREQVPCSVKSGLRLVYLSDLHFTRFSGRMAAKLKEDVKKLAPDLILLGGDYVESRAGLAPLALLLEGISQVAPVLAIAGNHDRFRSRRIQDFMKDHGVQWIEAGSASLLLKGEQVVVDGNLAISRPGDETVRVLCLHRPCNPAELPFTYTVVFAGHLHGGQCVWWENESGLYPGRFVYRWNRLRVLVGDCHYFISRGLGDTLPIRYNCPRELILLDLEPFNDLRIC